jgi:hypothetical protein
MSKIASIPKTNITYLNQPKGSVAMQSSYDKRVVQINKEARNIENDTVRKISNRHEDEKKEEEEDEYSDDGRLRNSFEHSRLITVRTSCVAKPSKVFAGTTESGGASKRISMPISIANLGLATCPILIDNQKNTASDNISTVYRRHRQRLKLSVASVNP